MRSFTAVARCASAVLVVVIMLGQQLVAGITIDLGGEDGWTNTNIDYDKWLSTFKIKIGDTMRFCNPDTTDHTAVDCDKEAYDTCGKSGVMESPFTIQPTQCLEYTYLQSGNHYVICDIPAHCAQGMKVYIQVLNKDGTVNTTANAPAKSSVDPMHAGFSWTSHLVIVLVSTFSLMAAAAFR